MIFIDDDTSQQNGNILFLILIAVALFAALSYAVTSSSRSGNPSVSKEKAQLAAGVSDSCSAAVNTGTMRVKMVNGCTDSQISFELPDGSNANPSAPSNKKCHIYHPAGAGVAPCTMTADESCMASLSIGASCNNVIYIGMHGGNRLYTTKAAMSATTWASSPFTNTIGTNGQDGLANTNDLLAYSGSGSPFPPAVACRALGEKWYLPSNGELSVLIGNANIGEMAGTVAIPHKYWSSTQFSTSVAYADGIDSGAGPWGKHNLLNFRCVRRA